MKLRYLSVSAEQAPWSRSGGLAEVAGSLPLALAEQWRSQEVEVICVSPLYPRVWREVAKRGERLTAELTLSLAPISETSAQLWRWSPSPRSSLDQLSSVSHLFIDIPWAFDREQLYGPPGAAYDDNPFRFACFSLAVVRWLDQLSLEECSEDDGVSTVIHCHDWQTSFISIYQRLGWGIPHVKTLFTIHNLMHQGRCDAEWTPKLGVEWSEFHMNFLEHWGQLNPMKGALISADKLTTVSPSYAKEILTADFACGLDTFFTSNELKVSGILNGLDLEAWSPYQSHYLSDHLPTGLSGEALDQELDRWKAKMKRLVSPRLDDDKAPLAVLVSRFDVQKGIEIMISAAETWLLAGGRLFVLGAGDPQLERSVSALAARHPDHCEVRLGFDLPLAHQLFAAADLCIIPSRFEPCGLTQMQAMRYGALPLATPVGGLRDSIIPIDPSSDDLDQESGNGFLCHEVSTEALSQSLAEAMSLWQQTTRWKRARARAIATDWSWSQSAQKWRSLIEGLVIES